MDIDFEINAYHLDYYNTKKVKPKDDFMTQSSCESLLEQELTPEEKISQY